MTRIIIFDPSEQDKIGAFRGGGRVLQIFKENLAGQAEFISNLKNVSKNDTLIIPFWKPFEEPITNKKIAHKQHVIIFDVIPVKFPEHFPPGIRGSITLWKNKRALKHYDKIITISEHSKRDIMKYLGIENDKVDVVYPTTQKVFFDLKNEIGDLKINSQISPPAGGLKSPFALYVGDANWNKNLVNLAKAIKQANMTCLFVGKEFEILKSANRRIQDDEKNTNYKHPELEEFHQFIQEVRNDSRFVFPGYVSDETLISLYQSAVCNVLVSRDEGFGLSYLEASTQKCPSVLSDIPVFHEVAEDTAIFADPHDPAKIAEAIQKYFIDDSFRKKMGEKAYERSKKFSPEEFRKQITSKIL